MPIQNVFAQRAGMMPQAPQMQPQMQVPPQMPTAPTSGGQPVNSNFMLSRALPQGGMPSANPPMGMPPLGRSNVAPNGYQVQNMMPPVNQPMNSGQNFLRMRLGI